LINYQLREKAAVTAKQKKREASMLTHEANLLKLQQKQPTAVMLEDLVLRLPQNQEATSSSTTSSYSSPSDNHSEILIGTKSPRASNKRVKIEYEAECDMSFITSLQQDSAESERKKQLLLDVEIRNKNDENARAQEMHDIAKRKALLELALLEKQLYNTKLFELKDRCVVHESRHELVHHQAYM
jgi:hypothetical protein